MRLQALLKKAGAASCGCWRFASDVAVACVVEGGVAAASVAGAGIACCCHPAGFAVASIAVAGIAVARAVAGCAPCWRRRGKRKPSDGNPPCLLHINCARAQTHVTMMVVMMRLLMMDVR